MIIYSHCLEPMCCTLPGFTHIRNLRNCWGLVMQAVRRTEPQVKMNKNRCNGRLSEDDSTVIASLELGYQVKFCRVKQCRFIWPLQFSGVRVFLWHDVALWIKTVVCVCVFSIVLLLSRPGCLRGQEITKNSRERKDSLIIPSPLYPRSFEGFTATKARSWGWGETTLIIGNDAKGLITSSKSGRKAKSYFGFFSTARGSM